MKRVSDRSYGIVPVRKDGDGWQFFDCAALREAIGHFLRAIQRGVEAPKEAAQRELLEETGLRIKRYFNRYPFSERYVFFHAGQRISKTVIYFLAEVEGALHPQQEELLDARWLGFSECCQQLSYARSVQICQQCHEFLIGLSKNSGRNAPGCCSSTTQA